MKTSIATVSISGTLDEKLAAITEAGFDGVEIFEQDFITDPRGAREVGEMVRRAGLEITLFQPFRDFEGMPEPHRSQAFERARRKLELTKELGADLMLICSNVSPEALGDLDRAAADLNELGDMAKVYGVRLGYEALAWGRHVNDHRTAWDVVQRADHESVGIVLDSFHTLARGTDLKSIRSMPADRIFHVQLADAPAMDTDLRHWSRHFRTMPGQGDLAVTDFMCAVAATGYDGTISLEIFNDRFRGALSRAIAVDGRRALTNLLDQVRRRGYVLSGDLPAFPDRVSVYGLDFVEFASRGREADALRSHLYRLGFREADSACPNRVSVWRQGGIDLIVNEADDGFARSFFSVHGTSVCAVGLMVGDAEDALERARALGSQPFVRTPAHKSEPVPAIRSVGDGLVHFVETSEKRADVPNPESHGAVSGIGLYRIDHIGLTVRSDEIDSWSLFLTSLFDTIRMPAVDIVDPDGLVRSLAIESPAEDFRITLNGASDHRTFAGRFIADSFGSSVQHIAFATEDILATASALRATGFEPLPVSRNYYADLAARFGMEEARVQRLADHNVLYDRCEDGEFFHFYSDLFGSGAFFEIVQRTGAYSGYGAYNAPFRIASQKRASRPKGTPRPQRA